MNNNKPKGIRLWDEMQERHTGPMENALLALADELKHYCYLDVNGQFKALLPHYLAKKCIACGRSVKARVDAPGVITYETCCN